MVLDGSGNSDADARDVRITTDEVFNKVIDLVNILVGAYVAVLAKSTDYWFKDKEDSEDKESQLLHENGNDKEKEDV